MKDIYYQVEVSLNDNQYSQECHNIDQVEGYIQHYLWRLEDQNYEAELNITISQKSGMIMDMI